MCACDPSGQLFELGHDVVRRKGRAVQDTSLPSQGSSARAVKW